MSPLAFTPPPVRDVLLSFPTPNILVVTLNRPDRMNALSSAQHGDLDALYRWFDSEPSLLCAVLTGTGRAFCVGADLKEWNNRSKNIIGSTTPERWNSTGFGGLSNRNGKKPVIAAVNGLCLGGGMEMVANCDLVVAGTHGVKFGLPEAKRGVVALAGSLPRLMRTLGKHRATELVLLGRTYTPQEMKEWGIVNIVVDNSDGKTDAVVEEAVRLAAEVAESSPDSVITSREGLRLGWEPVGPVLATEILGRGLYGRMDGGENMKEGLSSFAERRKPRWKNSNL